MVDGLVVWSVADLVSQRTAGGLTGGAFALHGYWTVRLLSAQCRPPAEEPGELEIWCRDGQWGITDANEAILQIESHSFRGTRAIAAASAHLTPWFASRQIQQQLFTLPSANWSPVPIEVIGHFDDPKAAECRSAARALCQDRFVIDEVVQFDATAVAAPTPSPSPTPFPIAAPPSPALTEEVCFLGVEKTVLGWTRLGGLGIKLQSDWNPDEYVYAIVTVDVIPIGDPTVQGEDTWHSDPAYPGHLVRWWGRQVCFAQEATSIFSGTIEGSTYLEIDDGRRIVRPYPFG